MLIKNLLPENQAISLANEITSEYFPWYWSSPKIIPEAPDNELCQMGHIIVKDFKIHSNLFSYIEKIVHAFEQSTGIKTKSIWRAKVNLIHRLYYKNEWLENIKHTDVDIGKKGNYISIVYYVSDSDGDTVIYDNDGKVSESIPPKQNNCAWFNSKTIHRSGIPIKHKRRIVINIVLEV